MKTSSKTNSGKNCAVARAWLLTLAFASTVAEAVDIQSLAVTREAELYQIQYRVRIDVPAPTALRYLTDFANLARLSDRILESRLLAPAADGLPRLHIVMEACVFFICRAAARTTTIERLDDGFVMRGDPALSDFTFAHEHWWTEAADRFTVVEYRGRFIPKFWIPPFIDTWLIERHVQRELRKTGQTIEALAREPADSPLP